MFARKTYYHLASQTSSKHAFSFPGILTVHVQTMYKGTDKVFPGKTIRIKLTFSV
jgi:hypothetical protein